MKYLTPKQQREVEWQRIREHWKGICAYCGTAPALLVREHVVPKSRGGDDEFENIVPACGPCNVRKGRRTPLEWFLIQCGFWHKDDWPRRQREDEDFVVEAPPVVEPRPTERIPVALIRPHPAARMVGDRCSVCGWRWVRPLILTDVQGCPVRDCCAHCYADPQDWPREALRTADWHQDAA